MGKFSIHIRHYRAPQLAGVDRHNRRLGKNHSNTSIDNAKSKDNLALKPVARSLYRDAKKRIQEEVLAKGHRVTKASVWMTEICCTLPEGIDPKESKGYFSEIVDYFGKLNGKDNILSAYVHLDETRPHLHLCVLPLTEDGHLSRKKIWTRQKLLSIHEHLPKYLRQKGYEVERGDRLSDFEAKDKAGMSMREYKIYREKEKIRGEYNRLVKDYNALADKYNQTAKEHVALKRGNLETARKVVSQSRERAR